MNLIEQLGSYDRAKGLLNLYEHSISFKYYKEFGGDFESAGYVDVFIPDLKHALLQYRRQHNIFEVGDKVFYKHAKINHVMTVQLIGSRGTLICDGDYFENVDVCHAEPEEIQAGKRLP